MKNKTRIIILGAVIVLAGISGVLLYQRRNEFFDWFSALSYTPTQEITDLENAIDITDSAKKILHATHPTLESRESFNENCNSHNKEVSILGCYSNNHIYLYDLNEESLTGVKESTLAHELLHAVWDRMSDSERSFIGNKLTEVYNNEQYNSLLSEDLEIYDESERMGELHSRIGTEIVELPDELESHYAKYFKDQDAIVRYFNEYITPFRELSQKIKELSSKLESLNSEIEEKTKEYYAKAEEISKAIDEFNNCANTSGCFSTNSDFSAKRNQLLEIKSAVEEEFNNINNKIKEYNAIVSEYNENIVRGQNLESIINSNAEKDIKEIK